jgi:hypothetical protein
VSRVLGGVDPAAVPDDALMTSPHDAPALALLDTFRGLPVHVLVLHATVVLVPLVALGVGVVAAVPAWRQRFARHALAASVLAVALVGVTILSGRELRDRLALAAGGQVDPAIERHESLGTTLFWFVLALAAAAAVLALVPRPTGRRRSVAGTSAVAAVVVVLAAATLVQTVRTGEAGSSAVWESIVGSTDPG